jgi:hypothetical protein
VKDGRLFRLALLALGALLAAASSPAQFVSLSRCRTALPCSLPWGIRYNPDPILGAQYGNLGTDGSALSIRLDPKLTQPPKFDLAPVLDSQDFARVAAEVFVLRHPAPAVSPPPAPTAKP